MPKRSQLNDSGKVGRGMTTLPHFLADGGEMGALMRAKSWTDTLLGPPETWPEALKMAVAVCLNSRFPISLWWGPELVMLYNDAWRPILGKTKHPTGLGRPGIESWPEIWDIIYPQFTSVLTRGEATWSDDLLLVLERNNYREEGYFTYSYSPIKNIDGSIGGVFSAITETTERVLGERRLRILRELAAQTAESKSVQAACEAFARVLGAGNPDLPFSILYLLDEDGTSASLLAKTGIDDTIAPAALRLDHDDPWGVARVIREGDVILLNDLALHFGMLPGGVWPEPTTSAIVLPVAKPGQKGGTAGVLVAGINPRRALDDAYRGFFDLVAGHLATAVSNARAYEEERKRSEALAEINRAKTQFFSNVSHEFRTPLTLMLGPLEEVLAQPETTAFSDDRSLVRLAHRNGVRLLKLVNTLLDFSRIEAGRVQASFQPIDLAVFTAELASNFRSAIERAGLRLVIDCPSLPHQVYVDIDMWEKVVLNLLSNAFKFTFEGEIGIAAKPSSDGRYAELTVHDTGTGIPPEELSHLFERFHRVEGARGRSIEGSGIGLALVQELIKLHAGTIRVTSEVGRGSTFKVVIPFGVGHLPADRIGRGRAMATANVRPQAYIEEALGWFSDGGTTAVGPPPPSASDERGDVSATAGTEGQLVLVADDNADMRKYVERLLRASGYRVEAVTDGKKALAAAQRLQPDLILSDVMMPELDGFGLLTAVRKDAELSDTPVLLLSARAGEEAKVEGLSAGADDYLVKPFTARELLARVATHIKMANLRRETAEREERVRSEAELERQKLRASEERLAETGRLYRELQDREAKIRRLVDANILGICMWNLEGAIVGANEAFLRMLQYSREDLASGGLRWTDLTPAAWRDRDERALTDLKATGTCRPFEKEYFRKDGSRVPVLVAGALFEEGGGEGVAFALDLSEQKQAEEALHRSEHYLAEAQRLTLTGSCAIDGRSRQHDYWSEEMFRIFGFDPKEGIPTWKQWFQRIHPEDRDKVKAAGEKAFLAKADCDVEFRIVHSDGTLKHIHGIGHPVLNPTGEIVQVVRTMVDITARKRAEQTLREQANLLNLTNDAIFVRDENLIIKYWNRGAEKLYGWTHEQAEEQISADLLKTRFPVPLERIKAELLSNGRWEGELVRTKKDGTQVVVASRWSLRRDDKGRQVTILETNNDITERKRAEDELRTAFEEIKQLKDQLYRENVALREEIDKTSMFEEIVGISPALHTVLSRVSKVAPTDSTVLITGETGTGKELIARAVHKRSQRSSRAFVSVNCAAIPRDLIASELFGHEKGAFTGATQRRLGRFELAEGGTIFLDEIGELPSETQIALLRVLQEHEFERVGGTGTIRTNVRVIAATNRDLEAAIAAGTFRSDLFYRLNVFPIEVPSLRERKEDIPVLVEYFIDRYASKAGKSIRGVNKKSLELLQSYSWPGNIRELQNVIERSVIVCDTENFSVDESWLSRQPRATGAKSRLELSQELASQEKEMIEAALRESGGQVSGPSGAAAKLGLPGSTLESKIRSLKISKKRFKATNPSVDRI